MPCHAGLPHADPAGALPGPDAEGHGPVLAAKQLMIRITTTSSDTHTTNTTNHNSNNNNDNIHTNNKTSPAKCQGKV